MISWAQGSLLYQPNQLLTTICHNRLSFGSWINIHSSNHRIKSFLSLRISLSENSIPQTIWTTSHNANFIFHLCIFVKPLIIYSKITRYNDFYSTALPEIAPILPSLQKDQKLSLCIALISNQYLLAPLSSSSFVSKVIKLIYTFICTLLYSSYSTYCMDEIINLFQFHIISYTCKFLTRCSLIYKSTIPTVDGLG